MYTYPTLEHLRAYPLYELMSLAGMNAVDLAAYFHRCPRTIRNWRKTPPAGVIDQLIALSGWLEIHNEAWAGWRVIDGTLLTDGGMRITPGEIRALPWLWAIRAEVLKQKRNPTVRPMVEASLNERALVGAPPR